jgi:hypothetical protein
MDSSFGVLDAFALVVFAILIAVAVIVIVKLLASKNLIENNPELRCPCADNQHSSKCWNRCFANPKGHLT